MKELFKSLADFQQEVPAIHKGTKGYGYSYADLATIFEGINPLLKKHNLGFTQLIQGDYINTKVFSTKTGDSLESNIDIPQGVSLKGMNEFQVMGSAITYLRRYALSAALGLVTDVDTDGNGVKEKPSQTAIAQKSGVPKPTTKRPPSKATSKAQPKATAKKGEKVVTEVNDQWWQQAKKSVEAGVYTIDDCFERLGWANEELKKKFKEEMS